MIDLLVSPLGEDHDLRDLDEPSLRRRLLAEAAKRAARTFVATGPAEPRRVLGCATLGRCDFRARATGDTPASDIAAVSLLRLFVRVTMRGRGLGAFLLREALSRSLAVAPHVDAIAIVAFAPTPSARAFYTKFGFLAIDDGERLVLPMRTVARALASFP